MGHWAKVSNAAGMVLVCLFEDVVDGALDKACTVGEVEVMQMLRKRVSHRPGAGGYFVFPAAVGLGGQATAESDGLGGSGGNTT